VIVDVGQTGVKLNINMIRGHWYHCAILIICLTGCATNELWHERGNSFVREPILLGNTIVVTGNGYDVIMGPNGKLIRFKCSRDIEYNRINILVNEKLSVDSVDLYLNDGYVDRGVVSEYEYTPINKMRYVAINIFAFSNVKGSEIPLTAKLFFTPVTVGFDIVSIAGLPLALDPRIWVGYVGR